MVPWGMFDAEYVKLRGGNEGAAAYSLPGLAFIFAAEDPHCSGPKGGVHPTTFCQCGNCEARDAMVESWSLFLNLVPRDPHLPVTMEPLDWQVRPFDVAASPDLVWNWSDNWTTFMQQTARCRELLSEWLDVNPHLQFDTSSKLSQVITWEVERLREKAGLRDDEKAPTPEAVVQARYRWPHQRGFSSR